MSIKKLINKLFNLENDIAEAENTVAQAPTRSGSDRSFNERYFNDMIEVDIGGDGSGEIRSTVYGREFVGAFNTVGDAVSSLEGILVGYDPNTEINIYGRGPLISIYEVLAFKMLVRLYVDRIKGLTDGGNDVPDDIPDDIPVSLSGNGEENSEERQEGRTAKVMEEINKDTE